MTVFKLNQTFRWIACLTILFACGVAQWASSAGPVAAQGKKTLPPPASVPAIFEDVTEAAGLRFQHYNGRTAQAHLPEIVGAGAALFDFDHDGDLDVYLAQGARLAPNSAPWQSQAPLRGQLFRNELVSKTGAGRLRFTDVTGQSGLVATGYGMGAAVGDFNNDGWDDLYVYNLGANQLWRNNGNGSFTDVSQASGTAAAEWTASAAFFDYDRDGWLDLFVVNYAAFSLAKSPACYTLSTARDYCMPRVFSAVGNHLYRNRGDGTFAEVTVAAGVDKEFGHGLGVVTADFNNDGWPDVYVANDGDPNQLWLNQHDGTFKNEAWLNGAAVNANGQAEAGMGVDAGDFDGNGTEDLFVTHLMEETNTLYVNLGQAMFEDRTRESGLALQSHRYTGFGTLWFDYDNDGWLDLHVTNGAVRLLPELVLKGDPFPYAQPNQLFRNNGAGGFTDVSDAAGPAFQTLGVGRGAAYGDIDNDGDTDVLVVNNHGPARLLLNQLGQRNHWLGLRLAEARSGRPLLGARVAVILSKDKVLWRRVRTDGGYLSAQDSRVLVGLGQAAQVAAVRVYWPTGKISEWKNPPIGRYLTWNDRERVVVN
jgi:hypothetical protein